MRRETLQDVKAEGEELLKQEIRIERRWMALLGWWKEQQKWLIKSWEKVQGPDKLTTSKQRITWRKTVPT